MDLVEYGSKLRACLFAFFRIGDVDKDGCSERGDENDDYGDDE